MSISERLAESLLSNPRADRVRAVAGLARRSARCKQGLFLAEGPQNVREALSTQVALGSFQVPATTTPRGASSALLPVLDALYVTESCLDRHPDIAQLVEAVADGAGPHRVFIRLVTDEVLKVISDAQTPQGAVAVCRIPTVSVADVLGPAGETNTQGPARLTAALCRVQDPGNAGTIIRAADAAGADAVILTSGSVDLHNPKTVRSTAGSLFHLPVLTQVEFTDLVRAAGAVGAQMLAADGYAALNLDELQDAPLTGASVACDLATPTVWLFGNEAQGLSDTEKQAAAHRVAVPLYGRAESLNVGTAATLCLYASARAQRR
ncbi:MULTISPECIES: TrmH family RNA methyltransferase [Kocuria]|uniref:RNA methyltransferase n=1 Tax=Kocuria subflava TaxID=1736139 RepID=A0A846TRV6_9MICC|nr:RNA methyltransferase [Kocuria sp. CPCC 104605]NKE09690.1 RNA methyltransferase [Kocuria subflava]